jgi:hypothetical protein
VQSHVRGPYDAYTYQVYNLMPISAAVTRAPDGATVWAHVGIYLLLLFFFSFFLRAIKLSLRTNPRKPRETPRKRKGVCSGTRAEKKPVERDLRQGSQEIDRKGVGGVSYVIFILQLRPAVAGDVLDVFMGFVIFPIVLLCCVLFLFFSFSKLISIN